MIIKAQILNPDSLQINDVVLDGPNAGAKACQMLLEQGYAETDTLEAYRGSNLSYTIGTL